MRTLGLHALMLLTPVLGALVTVLIKYNTSYVHPLLVISIRHVIGVPLLALYSYMSAECRAYVPTRKEWINIAGLGILNITFGTVVATYAIHLAGAIVTGIIGSGVPVIVCILSSVLKYEQMNIYKISGFVLTSVGASLVIGFVQVAPADRQMFMIGCAAQVFCTITWSIYLTLQKPLLETIPIFFFLSRSFGIGCVGVFVVVTREEYDKLLHQTPIGPFLAIAFNAIVQSGLIYWILAFGIKHANPTTTQLYSNLSPFLIAVLAYFFVGEEMHWNHFVGMFVTLRGCCLGLYGKHKETGYRDRGASSRVCQNGRDGGLKKLNKKYTQI